MSYAQDTGYLPASIPDLMSIVRENVNIQQGTAYTDQTFVGTNFYKYFYALIQRLQDNEVRTSEIFLKLQNYFRETNEKIVRPNTTNPGIVDYFAAAGYLASVKAPNNTDAGKIFIAIDVDDSLPNYDDIKLALCTIVSTCVVGGVVSQGTEVEAIPLSNGQSFDFKFYLPNRIDIKLRLTITQSDNNQFTIPTDSVVIQQLFDQINSRYRLGLNFEPQRYFAVSDAPWAEAVLLEYSEDGGMTWASVVNVATFDELFEFDLTDISLVNA